MENELKEKLQKNILEKIEATKEDIAAYEKLSRPVSPDNAIGRLTRMEAINSKSINEAALQKARATLKKLERSLANLDHPDFGLCQKCGGPIPMARLRVMPESVVCVPCAEGDDTQS